MVSTRTKRQSNKRILSELDGFDQDVIIGKATSERQEDIMVNEGTKERDFTVGTSSKDTVIIQTAVNVGTLERCLKEKID